MQRHQVHHQIPQPGAVAHVLKENNYQPIILYPVKISFRNVP